MMGLTEHHDGVQGPIQLPVPATVKPMADDLAGGRLDRGRTSQHLGVMTCGQDPLGGHGHGPHGGAVLHRIGGCGDQPGASADLLAPGPPPHGIPQRLGGGDEQGLELASSVRPGRYWHSPEPLEFPTEGSYADPGAHVEQPVEYGWQHAMGEIVSALAGAGLRIDFLHEFPFAVWQMSPFPVEAEPRTWRLPEPLDGRLPLTFSLKATKT
jgi:hypothetical protein